MMRKDLHAYIAGVPGFTWGRSDCLHFVGKWINRHGRFFIDPAGYQYETEFGAAKTLARYLRDAGHMDMIAAFDAHYERSAMLPPTGNICALPGGSVLGAVFGIVDGPCARVVGPSGVDALPLRGAIYWRVF